MSTVVVVSTGGTIAMRPDPETGKLVPAVSGEELVEMLAWPEAPPLELDDFGSVPSFDVHGELALSLARRVIEHADRRDLAGVVVTHGTDTMEETVFLIDRLLGSDLPVVLTGAQRGADETDSDGPRNLRDAIRAASSPEARGRGALISFAGELHAAREVRKVHTSALRAFAAPGYGPIGAVDGKRVVFQRRPERRPALPIPTELAPVDLIRLYAGSDARFVHAAVRDRSEGDRPRRDWSRQRQRPGGGGCPRRRSARGPGRRVLSLRLGARRARLRTRRRPGPGGRGRALRRRPRGPEGARVAADRARRPPRPRRNAGSRGRLSFRP